MEDALKALFELLCELLLRGPDKTYLTASLGSDNFRELWELMQNLCNNTFRMAGASVLGIFMMIEFIEMSDRYTSNQLPDLIKPVFMLTAKAGLTVTVIKQAPLFLESIFQEFNEITVIISKNDLPYDSLAGLSDTFADSISANGFWMNMLVFICMLLCFLAAILAVVFVTIVCVGRLLQVYLYIAISPIPLATLPNREWSHIGKGFLKAFVSLCVQGVLIAIAILTMPLILKAVFTIDSSWYSVPIASFAAIGVYLGTIKSAHTLANKVTGAM